MYYANYIFSSTQMTFQNNMLIKRPKTKAGKDDQLIEVYHSEQRKHMQLSETANVFRINYGNKIKIHFTKPVIN